MISQEVQFIEHESENLNRQNNTKNIFYKFLKIFAAYLFIGTIVKSHITYPNLVYVNLDQKIPFKEENNNLKVALCAIGKLENLYVEEFVEYYIKLGIDHLFIYDDNEPNTERISDAIDDK